MRGGCWLQGLDWQPSVSLFGTYCPQTPGLVLPSQGGIFWGLAAVTQVACALWGSVLAKYHGLLCGAGIQACFWQEPLRLGADWFQALD